MRKFQELLMSHVERYERTKNGTRKQLAQEIGITTSYLSMLLTGKRSVLDITKVDRFAEVLGLGESEAEELRAAVSANVKQQREQSSRNIENVGMSPETAGLTRVYQNLSPQLLADYMSSSTEQIRIMDSWWANIPLFIGGLSKALEFSKPQLEIKVLLLKPNSDHALKRGVDLGFADPGYVGRQIDAACLELESLRKRSGHMCKSFEIHQFDAVPSVQQIVSDESALIGLYMHGPDGTSQSGYQFEIRRTGDGGLWKFFEDEFDELWQQEENSTQRAQRLSE